MTGLTLKLDAYSPAARAIVEGAQALADGRKHAEITPAHVLHRMVETDPSMQSAVRRAGADPADLLLELELLLRTGMAKGHGLAYLGLRTLDVLGRAESESARGRAKLVEPAHLLLACAQEADGPVRDALRLTGLSAPLLRAALDGAPAAGSVGEPATPTKGADGAGALATYGTDLTARASQGQLDPVVGRDDELRRVVQILARRTESNPLLVGEPGVGKRAIVSALAQRMARGDVPRFLLGKRIVALDAAALVTGAKLRGQIEERLKAFLDAVRDSAGQVIAYAPELHALLFEGSSAGDLLASALDRREIQLLAVSTPDGLAKAGPRFERLEQHFVRVPVAAASVEETVQILRGLGGTLELAHGIRITDPALVSAANLARRYLPSAELPRAALGLIDEAAARVRIERDSVPAALDEMRRRREAIAVERAALEDDRDPSSEAARKKLEAADAELMPKIEALEVAWEREVRLLSSIQTLGEEIAGVKAEVERERAQGNEARTAELLGTVLPALEAQLQAREAELRKGGTPIVPREVGPEHVADVVATRTGIPVQRMLEGEAEKLLRMEDSLRARVVGQDPAVTAVGKAVRRSRVGLRDPKRPIGSFLFLGPSGVGKTELAKAVAEFLFDDEHALTRLDMSEFMEKHMVARLIGSPPGYVDSEEGGFLTEAVRKRPYSVILFDEIEKAHPDVFNVLLQVLDDGRLTDSRGRLAHFQDTVVVMTSNIGSRLILDHEGTPDALREKVQKELERTLRPEFLNRIDEIIVFQALGARELRSIVDIQLRGVGRLLEPQGIRLEVTDAARDRLAELGHEPAYGARPLKRVILRHLQDPLAEQILRGGYGPGDTVVVDAAAGAFTFVRRAASPGAAPAAAPKGAKK